MPNSYCYGFMPIHYKFGGNAAIRKTDDFLLLFACSVSPMVGSQLLSNIALWTFVLVSLIGMKT